MCAAHNRVARIGGYSPAQWALGRDLEERNNLVIQTAQGDRVSEMSHNLQARLRAEATYCKLQSEAKISRALNSRPQQVLVVKVAAATAIGYLTSTSSSSLDHCHQLFRKQINLHTKKTDSFFRQRSFAKTNGFRHLEKKKSPNKILMYSGSSSYTIVIHTTD